MDRTKVPWQPLSRIGWGLVWLTLTLLLGGATAATPVWTAVACGVALVGAGMVASPLFGLMVCLAATPVERLFFQYQPPTTWQIAPYYLSTIPVWMAFAAHGVRCLIRRQPFCAQSGKLYLLPLLFLLWTAVSLLWTLDLYHGVQTVYAVAACLAFFVVVNETLTDETRFLRSLRATAIIAALLTAVMVVSKYWQVEVVIDLAHRWALRTGLTAYGGDIRPAGFAQNNLASATLVCFLFVALAVYPTVRGGARASVLALAVALLFAQVFMASKAGLGTAWLGLTTLILTQARARRWWPLWMALVLTALVVMVVANLLLFQQDRLVGGSQSADVASQSLWLRLENWRDGFRMMTTHWGGAGAGGFSVILDPVPEAHNMWFGILFDLGPVGLLLFVPFVMELALRLRAALRRCQIPRLKWILHCLAAAGVALLTHALVNNFHYHFLFWLLAGWVATACRLAEAAAPALRQEQMVGAGPSAGGSPREGGETTRMAWGQAVSRKSAYV